MVIQPESEVVWKIRDMLGAEDVVRAYGDQRAREALENAAQAIADWVTYGQIPRGPQGAKAVILALTEILIPKDLTND